MKKGKTKSGFEFEVDENVVNDMRLVDAVAEVADGSNPLAISFVVKTILGDAKEALYKHVAEEDGRVPVEKINDEVTEIINLLGSSGKNS